MWLRFCENALLTMKDLRVAWTGEVQQALERVASNCSHFCPRTGVVSRA